MTVAQGRAGARVLANGRFARMTRHRFHGWWEIVVRPHPSLVEASDRHGARLFAGTMLVNLILILLVLAIAHPVAARIGEKPLWQYGHVYLVLVGWAIILGTLLLVRSGYYRLGASIYLGSMCAIAIGVPFSTGDPGVVSMVAVGTLAVTLASVLLPTGWCIALMLLIAGATSMLLATLPLPPHNVSTGFGLVLVSAVSSSVGLVVRRHTETVERERLTVIAEQEELRRSFMSNSDVGIYVADEQGYVVEWNRALERLSGIGAEDALGQPLWEVTGAWVAGHPEASASAREAVIRHVLSTGDQLGASTREIHLPRGEVTLLESSFPIRTGAGFRYGALVQDITRRKVAEAEGRRLEETLHQAAKMESIGQLAGGVAHDFNNLLTAIIGNADLALTDLAADAPARESLLEILRAGRSASALTRQLLAFSRKQVIEPRTLDLNQVVDDLRNMLQRLLGEDVSLETSLRAGPATILADPNQMEQILVNLAVNARDAMPDGGHLRVETDNATFDPKLAAWPSAAGSGHYVCLSVSDCGAGMTDEVKQHLFEPFFTTKAVGRGTGLGLAMVYGAVRQQNGEIEVLSEPGGGTTFRIYLPSVDSTPSAVVLARNATTSFQGTTVLAVEDDVMVRRLCVLALGQLGCAVLSAGDAASALELVRQRRGPINVLLTDVVLPEKNGHELAREVQELVPGIKIIFASGYPERIIAHRGVLEPGICFIGKPYTTLELGAKLAEALGAAPARRLQKGDRP